MQSILEITILCCFNFYSFSRPFYLQGAFLDQVLSDIITFLFLSPVLGLGAAFRKQRLVDRSQAATRGHSVSSEIATTHRPDEPGWGAHPAHSEASS